MKRFLLVSVFPEAWPDRETTREANSFRESNQVPAIAIGTAREPLLAISTRIDVLDERVYAHFFPYLVDEKWIVVCKLFGFI